jgi:hypothetical protein
MRCSTTALLTAIGAMLPLAAAAQTSAPAIPAAAPSPAASGSAHTARGTSTSHARSGGRTVGYGRSTIIVPPEAVNRALDAYYGPPAPHRAASNAQRRPTPKPSGGEEVFSTLKNGN